MAKRRTSYEENQGAGALTTGLLVLAAVGITYLMFREKPGKEPAPTPTPAPPPAPTPPPVVNINLPSPICLVTQARFTAWATEGSKVPLWAPNTQGAPPKLADVKIAFPELANVTHDLLVVATTYGAMIWSYNSAGEPFTNPKIKISLCTWIKEHPGV